MQADGTILIDTSINEDGFTAGTKELELAARRMAKTVQGISDKAKLALQKQVDSFSNLNNQYAQQVKKVEELKKKINEYSEQKLPTQEYEAVTKEIDNLNKKLDDAIERQIKFTETGGNIKSRTFEGMEYDIERLNQKLTEAVAKKDQLEQSGKAFQSAADTEVGQKASARLEVEQQKLENLNNRLENSYQSLKLKIAEYGGELMSAAEGTADSVNTERKSARQAAETMENLAESKQQATDANEALGDEADNTAKSVAKEDKKTKRLNKSLKQTSKSANRAGMGIAGMLARSILFSMVFKAISTIANGFKEGLDNLAQYSSDTNKALSLLMSAMTRLKNAFATAFSPLIEIAAPALAQFINLLAEAVTWTAQLLAALTGKDTFVRAVEVQQDYAESLDKTKDETEDAAKTTEKAIAPFDKLIQITSGKSNKAENSTDTELKPEQMFTTEEVPNQIKTQAEAIKNTLGGLFEPLKKSWLENGPQVMSSLKNTFSAIKQLASDVGASFMQVWSVEGYGKAITDDLLISFANLSDAVGNLVTNFDRAWVSGETGTNILRHIGDIILEITGFFREASQKIKEWSEDIDFSPLLESFDRVLVAIRPIVSKVGDALLWLLDNVLLPLASWGIEQALPAAFNLIAAALEALNSVIDALKPLGLWLWESFLKPLGEWTGEIIIGAIQKLTEWLKKFSDWCKENQSTVQNIAIAIVAFFAAWKIATLISGIAQLISSFGGFIGIVSRVTSILTPANLAFAAIVAVITSIIYLAAKVAQAWDKMTPEEQLATKIIAVAGAIALAVAAIAASIPRLDIVAIAGSIAAIAGFGIYGIVTTANNRASGSRSGYSASTYAAVPYQLPRLATGTVIPPRAGEFAAILGDNKRETEVVSPLSTMKKALKEALVESGFAGGERDIHIDLILDGQRFARAVYKANNQEQQRVGVRMVTNG